MPSQKSLESPSPSISSAILPLAESRRGSLTSQLSLSTTGKDSVSNALDHIHTTASRSEALTTFDEFSSPPRPQSSGEGKGFGGDIVQGGLSGLYSRIKASVGVTKEILGPSPGVTTNDPTDDASVRSLTSKVTAPKSSSVAATESPIVASASSSRLQSPLVASFPESGLSAQAQQPSPSNVSLTPGTSIPESHASSTDKAPRSPEELSQRPNSNSPLSRPSTTPRPIEIKKAPRLSNISDVGKNPRELIDGPGIPDIRVARQGDSHSFSSHDSSMVDQERTPRPLARLAVDNQRSFFDSSSKSPARRDTSRHDWTDKGKKIALASEEPVQNVNISRPPLIQVSQSHLPGFQVSRGNSTDGDYSSIGSGALAARKQKNEPVEDMIGRAELPSLNEVQDAAARMRSKVLAKELWMRDETAKECFYCGESFSTFRRKHHCRKFHRSAFVP